MKEIIVSLILSVIILISFYLVSEHKKRNTLILLNAIAEHNEKILDDQKKEKELYEDDEISVYIYENDEIIEFFIEDKKDDKMNKI